MWGIDSPLLAICMSSGADNLPLRENADLIPSRAVAATPAAALLWLTVQAQGRERPFTEQGRATAPSPECKRAQAAVRSKGRAGAMAASLTPRPCPRPPPPPLGPALGAVSRSRTPTLTQACVGWCLMSNENQRTAAQDSNMASDK